LDSARIDVLYHGIIQHQPLSIDDLMVTEGAVSTSSTMPAMEQIGI